MPDAPDDFEFSNVTQFVSNADNAELAARLYSPSIYARIGQILYMTDFTKGFSGFTPETSGDTEIIGLTGEYPGYGGLSMKMQTEETDPLDCYIGNTIPYVEARYYILDIGYSIFNAGSLAQIEFYVHREGTQHRAKVKHTFSTFKLELLNSSNNYDNITSLESSDSYFGSYNHFRMAIDTDDLVYQEISLNSVKFNIADTEYYTIDASYTNDIQVYYNLGYTGALNGQSYIRWLVISATDEI